MPSLSQMLARGRERVQDQMVAETTRLGVGKLDDLLKQGDTWVVPEGQTVS